MEEFKAQIDEFHNLYFPVTEYRYEIRNMKIDGDYAIVEVDTSWAGLNKAKQAMVRYSGTSLLKLKRSLDIGWDVIQARVIGWNYNLHD